MPVLTELKTVIPFKSYSIFLKKSAFFLFASSSKVNEICRLRLGLRSESEKVARGSVPGQDASCGITHVVDRALGSVTGRARYLRPVRGEIGVKGVGNNNVSCVFLCIIFGLGKEDGIDLQLLHVSLGPGTEHGSDNLWIDRFLTRYQQLFQLGETFLIY
jgi:hypothetical protein